MRVRNDNVLVTPIVQEEKGETVKLISVETPDYLWGCVVEVGKDVTDLGFNDVVVYGKYSGIELEVAGDTYRVLRQNDVLLVIVDGAKIAADREKAAQSQVVSCPETNTCCGGAECQ